MSDASDRTKSIAMAVLEAQGGSYPNASRMMRTLFGTVVSAKSMRAWSEEGLRPDDQVARDLPNAIAAVRMAHISQVIAPLTRRLRRTINDPTRSSKDVKDEAEALSNLLRTFDPTAAPGGQRGITLPAGGQGFAAWGPLPAASVPATGGAGARAPQVIEA